MSEENNSISDQQWENIIENSYDNQSPETDGDDELLDAYSESETDDGCTCYTPSVDSAEMQEPESVNWVSSPDPSSLDGYECGSEFEYLSATNEETAEPAADTAGDAEDEDAADNATEDTADNVTDDIAALSTVAQANDSRLDLRPVPASIDLTRFQPSSNWRAYQAHVRAFTRRIPFPDQRNRPAASAVRPRPVRLCGGQPSRPRIVAIGRDPDFGGTVYIRNDTDNEEEPPVTPLAMVPRRGNSVSDLSQCSSDEDTSKKKKRKLKRQ